MVLTVPPWIDTARSIAAALRRAIRAVPPIESVVSRNVATSRVAGFPNVHELEDGLRRFDEDLGETKRSIEGALRHEHWEHEPLRALAWRARSDEED
jgi:hypothetical protein